MSKTIFKLWSIRCVNDLGRVLTYSRINVLSILSITIQPLQGHQAVIAEYPHQVLKEFPHTHRPMAVVPAHESQHNANREAIQATMPSCFHHEFLTQQFAYLKDTAIKIFFQLKRKEQIAESV